MLITESFNMAQRIKHLLPSIWTYRQKLQCTEHALCYLVIIYICLCLFMPPEQSHDLQLCFLRRRRRRRRRAEERAEAEVGRGSSCRHCQDLHGGCCNWSQWAWKSEPLLFCYEQKQRRKGFSCEGQLKQSSDFDENGDRVFMLYIRRPVGSKQTLKIASIPTFFFKKNYF